MSNISTSSTKEANKSRVRENGTRERFFTELAVSGRGGFGGMASLTAGTCSEYSTPSRSTHCSTRVGGEARGISSVDRQPNLFFPKRGIQKTVLLSLPPRERSTEITPTREAEAIAEGKIQLDTGEAGRTDHDV